MEKLLAPISLGPRLERLLWALGHQGLPATTRTLLDKIHKAPGEFAAARKAHIAMPFSLWIAGLLADLLTDMKRQADFLLSDSP
eukprot:scaffold127643_cov25-Prasinocladus_malaysianus.AAC.1